MKILVVGTD